MDTRFALAHYAVVAGVVAGFVTTLLIWLVGGSGLLMVAGIPFDPRLTAGWIYTRMVWGGLWGLLFLLPLLQTRPHRRRGLVLGLAPAAVTLLWFNPVMDKLGILGLAWGVFWPVIVIAFNVLWGYLAGCWLDMGVAVSRQVRRAG